MGNVKRNFLTNVVLNISIFRIVYLCTLFLCSFCYVEVFANAVKYPLMIWGFLLIYFYYIRPKRYFDVMYARWLVGFIAVSILTAVIHIVDNFGQNLSLLAHVIICFFVLYGMHTERNKRRKMRELYFVATTILIATTVAMLVCFATLPLGERKIDFLESSYKLVIYENRLTGIFTNPNLLAFYSVVAVFCSHILSKDKLYTECGIKKKLPKWFLIICVIINILAMFLSDSNGSLLLLSCYTIGNLIYRLFSGDKTLNIKGFILRCFAVVLILTLITSVLFGLRWCSNKTVSAIMSANNQNEIIDVTPNQDTPAHTKDKPQDKIQDKINIVTFAHENDNLDSGRLALLQKAVVIFYNYPFFGVGKENIVLYGERLLETGLKYSDLHNGYLTILVSNGLIGFALFLGFAISLGRHCVKSLFLEKKNLRKSPFPCLFAFIFAYCIYAVLEKTILLEQTYMVVFFWYVLGYASCYMQKYNHIDDKFDVRSLFIKEDNSQKPSYEYDVDIIDLPTMTDEEKAENESQQIKQ